MKDFSTKNSLKWGWFYTGMGGDLHSACRLVQITTQPVQNELHFPELWVLQFHSDKVHSIICFLSTISYLSLTDSHILYPLSTLEVLKNSIWRKSFSLIILHEFKNKNNVLYVKCSTESDDVFRFPFQCIV